jgi:tetratricopeptide (TPR) repeat protein
MFTLRHIKREDSIVNFGHKLLGAGIALTFLLASPMILVPAYASGGGGGGGSAGGATGGSSLPRYDPVEEYRKGVDYLEAKDYTKAVRSFGRVLKVAGKDANTNYLMGISQSGLAKYKKAAKYYAKAVKYNPDLFAAHTGLANAYMKNDKAEKAGNVLAALEARLQACGENCSQHTELLKCRDDVKAIVTGVAVREEASLGLDTHTGMDTAGSQYFKAVALINQARYREAITDLMANAAVFGPHPDIMNYLGYSHRKLGLYDQAEHFYKIALSVDPVHRGANEYLGELYVETGQLEKARIQLLKLENICSFGCIEENELRGWITNAAP